VRRFSRMEQRSRPGRGTTAGPPSYPWNVYPPPRRWWKADLPRVHIPEGDGGGRGGDALGGASSIEEGRPGLRDVPSLIPAVNKLGRCR